MTSRGLGWAIALGGLLLAPALALAQDEAAPARPGMRGEARMHAGPGGPGMRPGMGAMHGGRGAWGMRRGGMGMGMGMGPMMLRELDLTEAQRAKVEDIHERTMKRAIQARADVQLARLDLGRLLRAERPDARAIDAQIDRIATLRAGIAKAHVGALLEVRGLLTPEQQKKLQELRRMGPGGRGHERMGLGPDDGEDEGEDPGDGSF